MATVLNECFDILSPETRDECIKYELWELELDFQQIKEGIAA